ncbi:MAG: hypothetical protein RDU20_11685, partial [Desulfomonilaceae bacterium]|nr:hypothetical protein [Desulfomonilaceae bacterium]
WERFLLSSDDGRSISLRKRTRTGRPAGDAAFTAKVEKITGRDLSKGNREDLVSVHLKRNKVYVPGHPHVLQEAGVEGDFREFPRIPPG